MNSKRTKMKTESKKVVVKSYPSKKHTFEIETTTLVGHTYVALKKNGNPVVKCSPEEFVKLRLLFCE